MTSKLHNGASLITVFDQMTTLRSGFLEFILFEIKCQQHHIEMREKTQDTNRIECHNMSHKNEEITQQLTAIIIKQ